MDDHLIQIGKDHLAQLDDYEDWQAEEALHSWVGDVAQALALDDRDDLAERIRLDGRVSDRKAIRAAFKDRIAALS